MEEDFIVVEAISSTDFKDTNIHYGFRDLLSLSGEKNGIKAYGESIDAERNIGSWEIRPLPGKEEKVERFIAKCRLMGVYKNLILREEG